MWHHSQFQAHLLGIFENVNEVEFHEKDYDKMIAVLSRENERIMVIFLWENVCPSTPGTITTAYLKQRKKAPSQMILIILRFFIQDYRNFNGQIKSNSSCVTHLLKKNAMISLNYLLLFELMKVSLKLLRFYFSRVVGFKPSKLRQFFFYL